MKRRDVVKTCILATSTVFGLLGCSAVNKHQSNTANFNESMDIKPFQTDIYKFSTPLPFNYKLIEQIADYNSKLKKSKIITLYNSVPLPLADFLEGQFQSPRGINNSIKNLDVVFKYFRYAKELGFNVAYVLNSPKAFSGEVFEKLKDSLFFLLDKIYNAGCSSIKVANTQLLDILATERPEFTISASTSFEYHNISQYTNLLASYPKIDILNVATDVNHNFKFLKNLKNKFPNHPIELIVNENCIHGCPARISHASDGFNCWNCVSLREKIGSLSFFCKANIIFPWDLEYYSAIGINSFKTVSIPLRANITNISYLTGYLDIVENGIKNVSAVDFFNSVFKIKNLKIKNNLPLADFIEDLPNIKHFIKYGDKCSYRCGINCQYCAECGARISEKLLK